MAGLRNPDSTEPAPAKLVTTPVVWRPEVDADTGARESSLDISRSGKRYRITACCQFCSQRPVGDLAMIVLPYSRLTINWCLRT